MLYMVTFTNNIPQMLAYIYIYIPYMDPMGNIIKINPVFIVQCARVPRRSVYCFGVRHHGGSTKNRLGFMADVLYW